MQTPPHTCSLIVFSATLQLLLRADLHNISIRYLYLPGHLRQVEKEMTTDRGAFGGGQRRGKEGI